MIVVMGRDGQTMPLPHLVIFGTLTAVSLELMGQLS